MGKEKYLRKIEGLFRRSPIVDAKSISRLIGSKKQIKQYDKQLIRNLILKGKIKKLTKGHYTLHDDPSLIVLCFSPAYLGLQDALSFHGLWEQETVPVIVTAKRARQGIRKVLEVNVLIRRINRRYILGIEYRRHGDFYLPVSDVEKTFIDMIYFRERMDKDLLENFRKRINIKKLEEYLQKYPEKIKTKALRGLARNPRPLLRARPSGRGGRHWS